MNSFYLDQSDEGIWLIKSNTERYTAGYDKQKAIDLIERLNKADARIGIRQPELNVIFVYWDVPFNNGDWIKEIPSELII